MWKCDKCGFGSCESKDEIKPTECLEGKGEQNWRPVNVLPGIEEYIANHQIYESGMKREPQNNRERFDLIAPNCIPYNETMLYRWAMLMAKGCDKYGERNWEKASSNDELSRFKQSAFRHFMKWIQGEVDEDHAAAVMFNISGAEMVKCKIGDNDGVQD